MSCIPSHRSRRPRPRFWIMVDDFESHMSPPPSPPRTPPYLRALIAARSVPYNDETRQPSKPLPFRVQPAMRSPVSEKAKLLPPPTFKAGFIEKSPHNEPAGGESDLCKDRWTATSTRVLQVLTFIICAAYVVSQLPHVTREYYYPATRVNVSTRLASVDDWIRAEAHTALRAMLANIGPAAGARDGIVVASPSTGGPDEPDYYYTWTRDAALTISSLLPMLLSDWYRRPWEVSSEVTRHNHTHPLLEGVVRSYVQAQAVIQSMVNPSGNLWTGGLSEPKFTTSGHPFTGSWGRPQRDGPALRALALIPYAHWLLDRGYVADINYVATHLYDPMSLRRPGSVIKNDLEEVANSWHFTGFDLWEEAHGYHLWGDALSRRALQAGAGLAWRLGDEKAASFYTFQAGEVAKRINEYAKGRGIWNASIPTPNGRTGLDAGTLLTVIHAGGTTNDSEIELGAATPSVLATLRAFVLSFQYPINRGRWVDGWLVGRYKGDVYDGISFSGGNPWYIATFSVAHVLYAAQLDFARAGRINMSECSAFWHDLGFDVSSNATLVRDPRFLTALRRLGQVGDAFVVAAARTVQNGRMSEQIDRKTGRQRGARDLTWSYASLLEMKRVRDKAKQAVTAVAVAL